MWHRSILSMGLALAVFSIQTAAHISLISPCPRYSSVGLNCPKLPAGQTMDTNLDMNTPINSVQLGGTEPLCKHTVPWPTPAATWTAGETVSIRFGTDAVSHSGGHAEFSISYDGGHTFVVLEMILRYVFVGTQPASPTNDVSIFTYNLTLPSNLPGSDNAIFAWTWVNASGNREFYMNCADVAIKGTSESISGKNVTIANYPGYPTIAEFNGNYETGIQYYTTDMTYVTVYGNGTSEISKTGNKYFVYVGASGANENVIFNLFTIEGAPSASADDESDMASSDDYDTDDESLEWCDDESDDESWEWCDDESTSSAYAEPVVPTNEPELMCDASYESELYSSNCDVFYSGIYVSNTFLGSDNDLNPLVIESLESDYQQMVTLTSYETSTLDENSDTDGLGGLDSESSSDYPESSETSPFSYSSTGDNGYQQFEYSSTSSSA